MSTADEAALAAATAQVAATAALVGSDADDAGDPTVFGLAKQVVENTEAPAEPTPLAIIDFENAVYTAGVSSYAVTDMLVGGDFDTGDISPSNGWFPQIDQYPSFGLALDSALGHADGFVVIFDVQYMTGEGALQMLAGDGNVAHNMAANITGLEGGAIELTPPSSGLLSIDPTDISVRQKIGFRISQTLLGVASVGLPEEEQVTGIGEFGAYTGAASFVEAGIDASWKVYSMRFYAGDVDMEALVA